LTIEQKTISCIEKLYNDIEKYKIELIKFKEQLTEFNLTLTEKITFNLPDIQCNINKFISITLKVETLNYLKELMDLLKLNNPEKLFEGIKKILLDILHNLLNNNVDYKNDLNNVYNYVKDRIYDDQIKILMNNNLNNLSTIKSREKTGFNRLYNKYVTLNKECDQIQKMLIDGYSLNATYISDLTKRIQEDYNQIN